MIIAVIGAGRVGVALGGTFARAGHTVRFGVRDPSHAREVASTAGSAVTTPPEATAGADIVVLAVPASAAVDAARGAGDLTGKILVDCTNPVARQDGPLWRLGRQFAFRVEDRSP